jgi:hypothetical protein
MSNSFYNTTSFPATGSPATSASMRAELARIAAAFDKMPTLASNANKLVLVNPSATGLTVLAAPSGDLVGTSATQTLTNKTINLASNTLTGTLAEFNAALSGADFASLAGAETLTNKTLTSPVIATIVNTGTLTLPSSTDTLVGRATTDTLTNKTISGSSNTLSNIANASLTNSAVTINGTSVSLGGSITVTATATNALTVSTGLQLNTGTTFNGSAARTISIDSTVATLTGSQTLTNKTISGASNTLSNIGNGSLTNSSLTIGSTEISLGGTATTIAGLTSVTSTAFVGALTGAASLNVLKTGDTMTGALLTSNAGGFTANSAAKLWTDSGRGRIDLWEGSSQAKSFLLLNTNAGGRIGMVSNEPLEFVTNNTAHLFLTAAGFFGVGKSVPSGPLHVKGANGIYVEGAVNTNVGRMLMTGASNEIMALGLNGVYANGRVKVGAGAITPANGGWIDSFADGQHLFYGLSSTENARLTAAGFFGLGTATPSHRFTVQGVADTYAQIAATGVDTIAGVVLLNDARSWVLRNNGTGGDTFEIRDATANAQRFTISATGAANFPVSVAEAGVPVVVQTDIGSAPNEIPLNQYLGEMAYMNAEAVVIQPQASVDPNGIGDMVFQLTNNTTLVVKVKGSDGTVRSATLTLA